MSKSLEARVTRLEKSNRRLLVILTLLILVTAAVLYFKNSGGGRPFNAEARASESVPASIRPEEK